MARFITWLWAATVPGTFLLAGAGMLWLDTTRDQSVGFYDRLLAHQTAWVGSHSLLFTSTVLMVPAAIALWRVVAGRRGTVVGGIGLLVTVAAAFLLAGQYAIDFVMPLVAKAGEAAHPVHRGLFETPYIEIPFYNLAEIGPIGLLLLTIALSMSGAISRARTAVLAIVWIALIAGNIADQQLVARISLVALGLALLPVTRMILSDGPGRESPDLDSSPEPS